MITYRAAADGLRRHAVGVGASHGGVTALVLGLLDLVWQRLAPVRAHAAAAISHLGERMPDTMPWTAMLVVAGAGLLAAAVAVVMTRQRTRTRTRTR